LIGLRPTTIWKTTPIRLSSAAYSIYSQLPSISGGLLFHPQPRDAPCRGGRDPKFEMDFESFPVYPLA